MLVNKDFEEFFALLNSHNVRFLLVGGYAVAFHGAPRYTGDIDVYYERSTKNAGAIVAALAAFGFESLGLTTEDFLTEGRVIQLGQAPNRIDLINQISGVQFSTAWRSRVADRYGEIPIRYIGKRTLLKNKRATNRDKDIVDVNRLTTMTKKKKK